MSAIIVAPQASPSANWRWLWLAVAVIALDQLSKHWIVASFRPGEELPLTPFASLVLAFNRGAAFSFLADGSGWQRWLFAVIAVVASAAMLWFLRRGGRALFCAGLALIIGGALGNLFDRLTLGNVADSAITVGAVALIIDSFRERRSRDTSAGPGGRDR